MKQMLKDKLHTYTPYIGYGSLIVGGLGSVRGWYVKKIDERFITQDRKIDTLFDKQDKKIDNLFDKQDKKIDTLFERQYNKMDALFER